MSVSGFVEKTSSSNWKCSIQTVYFCDESQQREVGEMFRQYDRSVEIIEQVRQQLTSTEKDQLNMMENLNDTLAEQAFFVYKFHVRWVSKRKRKEDYFSS